MNLIRLILVFLVFSQAAFAKAPEPVILQGDDVTIIHDGSSSFYDPHTEAGRLAIGATRGACCVEAPLHWHGQAEGFGLKGNVDLHINHESRRFVVNPRTGAFISTTTLENDKYPPTDPHRYIDTDVTPVVSLTPDQVALCSCKLGDRVSLTDIVHHQTIWAVYGNNTGDQGEGLAFTGISIGAAAALHIALNPVTKAAMDTGYKLTMRIYPGSGYGMRFPHGPLPEVK